MAAKENPLTFEEELVEYRQKIRKVKNQMERAMLRSFSLPVKERPFFIATITARCVEQISILEKEWKKDPERKRRIEFLEKLQESPDEFALWEMFEASPDDSEI